MKWIKRKLRQWVLEDDCGISGSNMAAKEPRLIAEQETLNFKIFAATNGTVLEFYKYDHHSDRRLSTVYIVNSDENLGDYINKCIPVELLKFS